MQSLNNLLGHAALDCRKTALLGNVATLHFKPMCVPEQEFKSRLDVVSEKLHGVDNVLGHQLAVHEMAGILGVGVPQVNTSSMSLNLSGGQLSQQYTCQQSKHILMLTATWLSYCAHKELQEHICHPFKH